MRTGRIVVDDENIDRSLERDLVRDIVLVLKNVIHAAGIKQPFLSAAILAGLLGTTSTICVTRMPSMSHVDWPADAFLPVLVGGNGLGRVFSGLANGLLILPSTIIACQMLPCGEHVMSLFLTMKPKVFCPYIAA